MSDTFMYTFIIFPIIIVLARMADVSLGTLRIILLSKGFKNIAPIVGFFEVFIWILVAKRVISDVPDTFTWSSVVAYTAYALGYALGTYIGMAIDKRLSLGKVLLRVILSKENDNLETILRLNKIGLTSVDAKGKDGAVKILFIVINRTELDDAIDLINEHNPGAFFTIENVQTVNAGYFPKISDHDAARFSRMFLPARKGK